MRSSYREGLKRIAPVAPASASFGIAFGILASTAGMGSVAPIVMSATTFAGSAQFAAASVLDDGGSIAAAVIAAVLLNARYLAISIAVSSAFEGSRTRRLLESQLIVDESWAVAQRGGRQQAHRAREHRSLVGEDVAEHVLRDHHVEVRGPAQQVHRGRIDDDRLYLQRK